MWRASRPPAFRAVTLLAAALCSVLRMFRTDILQPLLLSGALPGLAIKRAFGEFEDSAPAACCCPVSIEEEETAAGAEDTSESEQTADPRV